MYTFYNNEVSTLNRLKLILILVMIEYINFVKPYSDKGYKSSLIFD